jgi:hypothetical protein
LPTNANIIDFAIYNDRLYTVDLANNQIYRQPKEENGFVLKSSAERIGNYLVIYHNLNCHPGLEIYLTKSTRLEREATAIMKAARPLRKLPLDIDITLHLHPCKA